MFESVRPKIPEVMAIEAGDLVLRDYRRVRKILTVGENQIIRNAWKRLQTHLDKLRPGTLVCERTQDVRERYDIAFMRDREKNAALTRQEFEKTYIPVIDDSELDPRLGALTFVVKQKSAGVVGLFHLWNVTVNYEFDDDMDISAYASPSLETSRGMMHWEDIESIMRTLLEKDLHFVNGAVLDLEEWQFPTRADRAWVERRGELTSARRVIEALSDHDKTMAISDDGEWVPKRIKRRA